MPLWRRKNERATAQAQERQELGKGVLDWWFKARASWSPAEVAPKRKRVQHTEGQALKLMIFENGGRHFTVYPVNKRIRKMTQGYNRRG